MQTDETLKIFSPIIKTIFFKMGVTPLRGIVACETN